MDGRSDGMEAMFTLILDVLNALVGWMRDSVIKSLRSAMMFMVT